MSCEGEEEHHHVQSIQRQISDGASACRFFARAGMETFTEAGEQEVPGSGTHGCAAFGPVRPLVVVMGQLTFMIQTLLASTSDLVCCRSLLIYHLNQRKIEGSVYRII